MPFRTLSLLTLILLIGNAPLHGQKLQDWLRFAEEAKEEGKYHEAVHHLQKAQELEPQRLDITYRLAHAFRHSHLYEKALEKYQKVAEEDRRGDRFPDCLLWLAEMQEMNGDYRAAKRSWGNLRRRHMRDKDSYLYRKADQGIRSCDWAGKALEEKGKEEVEREEFPINTKGSEFAPFILQDSLLYFSVLRAEEENQDGTIEGAEPRSRILKAPSISKVEEDQSGTMEGEDPVEESGWGEPVPVQGPWEKELHAANSSFTEDGKTLFFSLCEEVKGEKRCDIVRSSKGENGWSEPEPLPFNRDSSNDTHPMMAKMDGKEHLFFSSDRCGGKGKMDIWWVERKGEGQYGEVVNAGDSINSPDNEITPSYLKRSGELYFASDWHEGLGGYDLFKSERKKEGFGEPENLGASVNSNYNELYPHIDVERNLGYFASNREEAREGWVGMCCNDIFHWPIDIEPRSDTVKIRSVEELDRFLPVTLYFHNDRPDPRTRDTTTKVPYDDAYRDYKERVPTYMQRYSKAWEGGEKDSAELRMKGFFDQRVDKGMQDLRLFSQLLLKELEKGQDIELTIKGYASPLAETQYNVNLTKRRIASLVNFLREYQEGVYLPYLSDSIESDGNLSFLSKPYGEYSADSLVSDELQDEQGSVYSVAAALERKIEIEKVEQVREDSVRAELELRKGVHDFGTVHPDSSYEARIPFRNSGEDTLWIDSIQNANEELRVGVGKKKLDPGEESLLELTLDGARVQERDPSSGGAEKEEHGRKKKQLRRFSIISNGVPEEREFSVTYESSAP